MTDPAAQPRRILVTSALPYANGAIHLGHLVEYIQTDIWVRFQKMRGHECYYVCADDAHGTAIMLKAEESGETPEGLIERVNAEHRADFESFYIGFDNYYSTHSPENRELAELIREVVGSASPIEWDADKPDGTPRKLLDVSRLRGLGWTASVGLREGIASTYDWYLATYASEEAAA